MKVKELIEELERMDGDAPVHFSYNYGDHWRTTGAPGARRVEDGRVVYSDYHRMPMVVDEDDKRYASGTEAVIIS